MRFFDVLLAVVIGCVLGAILLPFAALRAAGCVLHFVGNALVHATDPVLDAMIVLPEKWEQWRARRDIPL